ncbi:unnamed protein product, partial [Sphacelaria rigidula]
SNVIPTIPTIPRYFEMSRQYLPYPLDQVFSKLIPTIQRYPLNRAFSKLKPTIPTHTTVRDTPVSAGGIPDKYGTRCTPHGAAAGPNLRKGQKLSEQVRFTSNIYPASS